MVPCYGALAARQARLALLHAQPGQAPGRAQRHALGQDVQLSIELTLGGEKTRCEAIGQVMRVEVRRDGRFGVAVRLRKNFFPMTEDFVDTAMRDTIPATLDTLPAALDTVPAGLETLKSRSGPGRR